MEDLFDLVRHHPVWSKIVSYSLVIFFIRLADSLVSFWAPDLIQSSLNSSFLMGLVISFQSVIGLAADIIFPIFLKKGGVKKLTFLTVFLSFLTVSLLYVASFRPFVILFLIAMAVWGIYYELAAFSVYLFVDHTVPHETKSGAWGVIDIFISLAYLLGPFIAVYFLARGNIFLVGFVLVLLIVAFLVFSFKNRMYDRPIEASIDGIKPFLEVTYWRTLLKSIWPIVLVSFIIGILDSTFWTTGVIWTTKLMRTDTFLGSLVLPLYQLPTIFMGLLVAKWGIYEGKKRIALKFLILAGIVLGGLAFSSSIGFILIVVLIFSVFFSIAFPLVEGVYSDIIARMGGEKKHLIGFNSAVTNISYIVWPPLIGFASARIGERYTFVFTGLLVAVIALVLYFIMPRKLKLDQIAIGKWKE